CRLSKAGGLSSISSQKRINGGRAPHNTYDHLSRASAPVS
ncbi:hypothetical protein CFC21_059238, partial [Triticum aestivum]